MSKRTRAAPVLSIFADIIQRNMQAKQNNATVLFDYSVQFHSIHLNLTEKFNLLIIFLLNLSI